MVAVAVDDRRSVQGGSLPSIGVVDQELGEQERLPRQPLRVQIIWKEVGQLVAEHGQARWLQSDHRNALLDEGAQRIQDPTEQVLGEVEHAVVVQGTPAAE